MNCTKTFHILLGCNLVSISIIYCMISGLCLNTHCHIQPVVMNLPQMSHHMKCFYSGSPFYTDMLHNVAIQAVLHMLLFRRVFILGFHYHSYYYFQFFLIPGLALSFPNYHIVPYDFFSPSFIPEFS